MDLPAPLIHICLWLHIFVYQLQSSIRQLLSYKILWMEKIFKDSQASLESLHLRHHLMRTLVTVLALAHSLVGTLSTDPKAQSFPSTPFLPPSIPLAVRSPYTSTWLPGGTGKGILAGAWAEFWTGAVSSICGVTMYIG